MRPDVHPLTAARRRRALSRVAVARATGVSADRLREVEHDAEVLTVREAFAVGPVLGVDAMTLHERTWRANWRGVHDDGIGEATADG